MGLKIKLLCLSLAITGGMMKWLGPPGKLDGRLFYTSEEAQMYLSSLSLEASKLYFWGEIFDLWFLINYSWIFYLTLKRKWVLLPGLLDFVETSLILLYLTGFKFPSISLVLPFFSLPKWLLAMICSVLLIKAWSRELKILKY